jgi:PadR family transcriptional regulator
VGKPSAKSVKETPARGKGELLKGTLDMLVLQTLTVHALHGYAIAQQIESLSDDALRVEQGSLYPALERLQKKGWITSKWGESPTGRRARYYTLSTAGRRQLGDEISSFDAMLVAINRVLRRA